MYSLNPYALNPYGVSSVAEGPEGYTFSLEDGNKVFRFTTPNLDVTIPTQAAVNFPVNTILTIRQAATGTLVLITTGLTINGTPEAWAQHVEQSFRKVGADEWDVI